LSQPATLEARGPHQRCDGRVGESHEERQRPGHARELVPVHIGHREDVPDDLLHRRWDHYTSETDESRRGNSRARLKQKSKEQCLGPRTRLAGHGGPPRGKFSPLPHRRKEAHRDDFIRKPTTLAIWAHGELERDGWYMANFEGDGVRLRGDNGDGESLNQRPTMDYRPSKLGPSLYSHSSSEHGKCETGQVYEVRHWRGMAGR